MCGISLAINKDNFAVNNAVIEAMNNAIVHRGPDGSGYYFGSNFAFGHRRLSIIDISDEANQPMAYGERYHIIYNGEIYNYKELRRELVAHDMSFSTVSDTEVVLAAYAFWGADCVKHFNGMWSFALYDKKEDILFCSRDRFGIKPFYYSVHGSFFYAASEIKQLLPFFSECKANLEVLIDYLVYDFLEHTDETFFCGIQRLPAGHNLIYDLKEHTFFIERYYNLSDRVAAIAEKEGEEKIAKHYRELLENSIELRLRSDVMVGTCLSGGLDSSSVAAIAARKYKTDSPFTAITAKSSESEFDESSYAMDVATHCKLDLKVICPHTEDFITLMDTVVMTQEEPFCGPSIFMQYFVMQTARKNGCKVMLDGQGGDETLLGYERYYPAAYYEIAKNDGIGAVLGLIMQSRKNNAIMSFGNMAKYLLGCFLPTVRRQYAFKKCDFLKTKYQLETSFFELLASKYKSVRDLQIFEIERSNLPALLKYEDKNSMAHSVEARLPLIDYRLVEYALTIDCREKMKAGWTKYVLRKAMINVLPENVRLRKAKLGFNAPDKTWLSAYEQEMKNEVISSKILQEITKMDRLSAEFEKLGTRLQWRLFNIVKWEKLFHVTLS